MQNVNEVVANETCVSCNEVTEVLTTQNVQTRDFYVEGAGQLCETCFTKIYS